MLKLCTSYYSFLYSSWLNWITRVSPYSENGIKKQCGQRSNLLASDIWFNVRYQPYIVSLLTFHFNNSRTWYQYTFVFRASVQQSKLIKYQCFHIFARNNYNHCTHWWLFYSYTYFSNSNIEVYFVLTFKCSVLVLT